MKRYKAINEYAHYGEVHLINGKGYALHWTIDNSAPCSKCALFNNVTTDSGKMCMHPDKENRLCKHNIGTTKGWDTREYVYVPKRCIAIDEQLSLF